MRLQRRSLRLLRRRSMQTWSDAPPEVLGLVAERINSFEGFFRFGGVCKSWRSVLKDKVCMKFSPKSFPWLMFPQKGTNGTQKFFNLLEKKPHKLNWPIRGDFYCWGSPYGWVVVIHSKQVELVNPLSSARISLPRLTLLRPSGLQNSFDCRAVLSRLSPDQLLVTIIFPNGKLAFTKPGDKRWTVIQFQNSPISDVLYLNNQFYVINTQGVVRSLDIFGHPKPAGIPFALPPNGLELEDDEDRVFYLVELLGEMHMVVKFHGFDYETDPWLFEYYQTYFFKVFKLDSATRRWNEVHALGDHAIFVGNNTSFSLPVSDYPQCRSGSIYFNERWLGEEEPNGNMVVFNVRSMVVDSLAIASDGLLCSPPIWFTPKLC